ncbi:hypothetical protein QTL95_01500 [Rhizobium sp. S152]|uniref:hypothetical protein n=1 Tax=Rhizobium sp. S152 TaxID=3055038 RepID=UPI0025A96D91|nr:hypothetical protein [Rhizobium sp. S152]MDM9624552.1 hypothetical protein [Rhizobium sp. S152]
MFGQNELYSLNVNRMLADEVALQGTEYRGQIVLGGPDAAIEISGLNISLFMHGAPTENQAFKSFVDGYRKALVKLAKKLRDSPDDVVVIAGKWHHVEFHCEPLFAPYVIHIRAVDGSVRSQPYDIELFDTDDLNEGRDTTIEIDDLDQSEILEWLRCATESTLWRFGSSPTSSGHPSFSGMLWRPEDKTRSPVYIHFTGEYAAFERQQVEIGQFASLFSELRLQMRTAAEQNAITDGLRLAIEEFLAVTAHSAEEARKEAMGRMLEILSRSPIGLRNGHPIFRNEMPTGGMTTLDEIANSTTASGYWMQMRDPKGDFDEGTYHQFEDRHRVKTGAKAIVLRRVVEADGEDVMGCQYVSDWEEHGGYEFRRLAIGPVPTLSW